MTRPIGEVFTFFDHKLVVVKDGNGGFATGCGRCELRSLFCDTYRSITGYCGSTLRDDKKCVHFEKKGGQK